MIDWWVNGEGQYLNAARTCALIATSLSEVLSGLPYHDDTMSIADWQGVAARVFREAFRGWQKQGGDFAALLTQILQR